MFSNACAISDGDFVLVTGGTFSEFSVTRYNRDGVINDPDLPYLSSGRWSHACAKYLNDQQETVKYLDINDQEIQIHLNPHVQVYIVAGGSGPNGTRYNTAEILVRGAPSWVNISATIPMGPINYFSGINLNGKVYFLGK